jgi:hypothetical protein
MPKRGPHDLLCSTVLPLVSFLYLKTYWRSIEKRKAVGSSLFPPSEPQGIEVNPPHWVPFTVDMRVKVGPFPSHI